MASKGKREVPFQEVKIFNERGTDAYVNVQLCLTRGGPAIASKMIYVPANTPIGEPVPWNPTPEPQNVLCVKVDTYLPNQTTNDVTFGPTGVGLPMEAPEIYLENVLIGLSNVSDVNVSLLDDHSALLRSARQLAQPMPNADQSVALTSDSNVVMQLYDGVYGSGQGIWEKPPTTLPLAMWTLMPASSNPATFFLQNSDGTATCALGRWWGTNPEGWNAGQYVPPQVGSAGPLPDQLLPVDYYDSKGLYLGTQIVDAAMGLALTTESTDGPQQLHFAEPDSVPSSMQFWTMTTI